MHCISRLQSCRNGVGHAHGLLRVRPHDVVLEPFDVVLGGLPVELLAHRAEIPAWSSKKYHVPSECKELGEPITKKRRTSRRHNRAGSGNFRCLNSLLSILHFLHISCKFICAQRGDLYESWRREKKLLRVSEGTVWTQAVAVRPCGCKHHEGRKATPHRRTNRTV